MVIQPCAMAALTAVGIVRIADALGNRPGVNIAGIDVPAVMAVICGSAAGEFGHGPHSSRPGPALSLSGFLKWTGILQVTTEFLNNFPQVVRVLFDQSPRLLHAWRFWLWRFFASVLFARLAHELDGLSHGWESPREGLQPDAYMGLTCLGQVGHAKRA